MNNNLPIYIINLAISTDRRDYISEQLLARNISNYQFFPAIHATKEPNHPLLKKYNAHKHFNRKGRLLSLPELGCFASHYLLWEKCINEKKAMIVLEDDANLQDNFIDFYNLAHELANKYAFLWLHKTRRGGKFKLIEKIEDLTIRRFSREYLCTTGYLITPSAAQKLITYCKEWIYPVDDTMARFYENGVKNLALYPPCIDDTTLDSIIDAEGRKKCQLSLWSKAKREFYNAKDSLKRIIYNLTA